MEIKLVMQDKDEGLTWEIRTTFVGSDANSHRVRGWAEHWARRLAFCGWLEYLVMFDVSDPANAKMIGRCFASHDIIVSWEDPPPSIVEDSATK